LLVHADDDRAKPPLNFEAGMGKIGRRRKYSHWKYAQHHPTGFDHVMTREQ